MQKRSLIEQDYRYRLSHKVRSVRFNRNHALFLAGSLGALSIAVALTPQHAGAIRSPIPSAVSETAPTFPSSFDDRSTPSTASITFESIITPPQTEPVETVWRSYRVKSGDNLATLFAQAGVDYSDLQKVLALREPALKRIYPGEELRFQFDRTGTFLALHYILGPEQELHLSRTGIGFTAERVTPALDRRATFASGTIDTSLFTAAQRAGLPDRLTMELADIFGYDIDFALDIRQGDSFTLVYEQVYKGSEKIREGSILAAEFTNVGETYRAIRFELPDHSSQYYSPEGAAMRKAFLRTPVEFSRISSTFSAGRRHPVLNRIRAHKGVDYAAPVGTPVRATGDGKVVFRGTKGGYGSTMVLQHGSQYSTLYAHLSRFASSVRVGTKVQQGQIIGYVGQTGLATGPHLHYEFRVNDVHRDPLKVKFPTAEPIPSVAKNAFDAVAQERLAQMARYKQGAPLALSQSVAPGL